jgi:hypothetical protein
MNIPKTHEEQVKEQQATSAYLRQHALQHAAQKAAQEAAQLAQRAQPEPVVYDAYAEDVTPKYFGEGAVGYLPVPVDIDSIASRQPR